MEITTLVCFWQTFTSELSSVLTKCPISIASLLNINSLLYIKILKKEQFSNKWKIYDLRPTDYQWVFKQTEKPIFSLILHWLTNIAFQFIIQFIGLKPLWMIYIFILTDQNVLYYPYLEFGSFKTSMAKRKRSIVCL